MADDLNELVDLPDDFCGVVRLFPLPNLVMFPHVMQPFHIFESRYREMLEDALQGDRLIAMALLRPGWETEYEGRPAIHPVICVGRVVSHARDAEDRYNLLLLGLRRAAIDRELPPKRSYREAEVRLLEEQLPPGGASQRSQRHQRLLEQFGRFAPQSPEFADQFDELLSSRIGLGVLTDIVAFTMDFELPFKQRLLGELNIDRRAEMLLSKLDESRAGEAGPEADGGAAGRFPPPFSDN
jgi:ATP-dependent Lon protease